VYALVFVELLQIKKPIDVISPLNTHDKQQQGNQHSGIFQEPGKADKKKQQYPTLPQDSRK
jgi:hypothetical protein